MEGYWVVGGGEGDCCVGYGLVWWCCGRGCCCDGGWVGYCYGEKYGDFEMDLGVVF